MSKTLNLVGVGSSKLYLAKDGTYNEAWAALVATGTSFSFGQYYSSNDYVIGRGTHKIDTRVIPVGATIVSGTVTFYIDWIETDTDWDLVIQSIDPPSASPDNTWYNKANYSGNGGSLNTSGLGGYGTLVTITMNEAGLGFITKDDYSTLGIRSSRDIAGIQPSGIEYLTYYSYVKYNITYTAVPAVTTNPATGIEDNQVYAWGKLTQVHDDAGCDKIGICYNKTGNPTIADSKVEEDGSFWNNKTFIKVLTGLDSGTTYYFKAYSRNPTGYGYGIEREFTTTGEPPTAEVTTDAVSYPAVIPNHSYEFAEATGTVTGDEITERGFEVKHAFSGDLHNKILHSIAGFEGDAELVIDSEGIRWEGELIKTESEDGSFDAGEYTMYLGKWPAFFADKLFAGESYHVRARATIGGEEYFGEWMAFSLPDFPPGTPVDDQLPIEDMIPIEVLEEPVIEPFESPFEEIEDIVEEFPEFEWPAWEFPEFDYPEIPPYNGSWLGWFYYRKAYAKRDLDELRKKCRIFQDNSVEYALVINHNSRALQQFLNSMTIYMDADEYNTFRPIIPPQHLNELARKPLNVIDFREMINNFISNSIDNANNVNNNFRLIRGGLGDYTYTEDVGFTDIAITTRLVNDNNPDVESLKRVVDRLNREMASNYGVINHNLHVLRSVLI